MADIQSSLRQSHITRFFRPTGPPKPEPRATFLHLPPHIRNKIYDEANVGGNKFIFLNLWAPRRHLWVDEVGEQVNTFPTEYDPDIFEDPFPNGLLLASSHIHREVEVKLYSENAFAVSLMGTEGLWPLETLSDTALQELRVLIVSLLPCHCLTPKCTEFNMDYGDCGIFPRPTCWDYWNAISCHYNDVWGGHSRPLSLKSRTDKHILRQWERICARLATNTRWKQLKLYLVTQVDDRQTFNAVLDPLRSLPALKDVALKVHKDVQYLLSDQYDFRPALQDAALNLLKGPSMPVERPFRFLSLPREIQLNVLDHSELANHTIVEWGPKKRYHYRDPWECYGWDETHSVCWWRLCTKRGAAFNTFCKCRLPRFQNYFLVSRTFTAVARPVFYRAHEFRVLPTSPERAAALAGRLLKASSPKLTLLSFLNRRPLQSISSLRHLTIVVPPLDSTYLFESGAGWREWSQSIEILAQLSELRLTRLEIHFSDQHYRENSTLEEMDDVVNQSIMSAYRRLLEPLVKMRSKLCALLVYRAYPSQNEDEDLVRHAEARSLEKMVMGDDYDSAEWGKAGEGDFTDEFADDIFSNCLRSMFFQHHMADNGLRDLQGVPV